VTKMKGSSEPWDGEGGRDFAQDLPTSSQILPRTSVFHVRLVVHTSPAILPGPKACLERQVGFTGGFGSGFGSLRLSMDHALLILFIECQVAEARYTAAPHTLLCRHPLR